MEKKMSEIRKCLIGSFSITNPFRKPKRKWKEIRRLGRH